MSNPLMDMKMDGVPFGEIMNQAVKLKTHQAKPDRWRWDAWPKFKQNTMFSREEVEAAREHDNFEDRLKAAYDLKSIADDMFRSHRYLDATYKYENSTAVFRWLTNKDEGWKKKGIFDSDIDEHAYTPLNEGEATKMDAFLIACYLNIARLYHKRADTPTAIEACSYALEIDQQCDKALLLRAQVRLAPKSAGGTEQELSYKDAINAQKVLNIKLNSILTKVETMKREILIKKKKNVQASIEDDDETTGLFELDEDGTFDLDMSSTISLSNQTNQQTYTHKDARFDDENEDDYTEENKALLKEKTEIVRRSREVNKYVNSLKMDKQTQRELDKEWGGVFNKGIIYDATTSTTGATNKEEAEESREKGLSNQITDAQRLLQMYEQSNRHEDADRIRGDVETSKNNFENFKKSKSSPQVKQIPKKTDFFNPTPEMKKDALERGLDLEDPVVLKMLQKLQKSHESGIELTDESIDKTFESDKQEGMDKLRAEVTPLIKEMTSKELRDALKLLHRTYQKEDGTRLSHEELVENMIQLVIYKAEKGESLPDLSKCKENNTILSKFTSSASLFFNNFNSNHSNHEIKNENHKNEKLSPSQVKQLAEEQQTRTFRITFFLASLFFLIRLWYGGQLSTLVDLFRNGDLGNHQTRHNLIDGDDGQYSMFGDEDEEIDYEFLSEF